MSGEKVDGKLILLKMLDILDRIRQNTESMANALKGNKMHISKRDPFVDAILGRRKNMNQ